MPPDPAHLADLFDAALSIAAEHDPALDHRASHTLFDGLIAVMRRKLPSLSNRELGQPLLRQLASLGFAVDDRVPPTADCALIHRVITRRRASPTMLALLSLALARRLEISLGVVDAPGRPLLRTPAVDALIDPAGGRRLSPAECRELMGSATPRACSDERLLQRLSQELRDLHAQAGETLGALRDAERALRLGPASLDDHLARADLYRHLECPGGERFDLQQALLLADNAAAAARIGRRLTGLSQPPALH